MAVPLSSLLTSELTEPTRTSGAEAKFVSIVGKMGNGDKRVEGLRSSSSQNKSAELTRAP